MNSNNATLGYDRYQVLNPEYLQFELAVLEGYGKFKESRYPFQVWEPSDQYSIDSIIQEYLNSGSSHDLRGTRQWIPTPHMWNHWWQW